MTYDPKGRPGEFFKSVKVDLYDGTDRETVYIGIRGKVIKETSQSENEKPKLIHLELPPFKAPFRTPYDTAFFELSSLNRWINWITYEMDKTGYLFLNFELRLAPTKEKYHFILRKTKERIKSEIRKRGYPDRLVLFQDSIVVNKEMKTWKMGEVHLSSVQFNNDSISHPLLERKNQQKTNQNNVRDAFYYIGSVPKKLKGELKDHLLN